MVDLISKVENILKKHEMVCKGDRIVAGISGGPDSMCMLHIFLLLKDKYDLSIFAAHLNHQFRGEEADKDALYVKSICEEWGIPVYIKSCDVSSYATEAGLSDEEAGRIIRYELYDDVARKVNGNKIAVAHNKNDHVETVLMNLIRGSGIEGLKGIEARRGRIIRPLINIERIEIEKYCQDNQLDARIDKTNLMPIYGRNKVRLELIPYIRDNYNPNIMDTLYRFSDIVAIENDYLEKETIIIFAKVASWYGDSIKYNINGLKKLHRALQRRVLRQGIEKLLGNLKGIGYKHIEDILSILNENTNAAVMLPYNLRAYISYRYLVLGPYNKELHKSYSYILEHDKNNIIPSQGLNILLKTMGVGEITDMKKDKNTVYIDKDRINKDLRIRNRLDGDIFSPIGLKGSKKLKKYFIDEKIPREERDNIRLIADGGDIVWVVGKRLSEKYKITSETKKVVMIKIE